MELVDARYNMTDKERLKSILRKPAEERDESEIEEIILLTNVRKEKIYNLLGCEVSEAIQ